MSEVIEHGETPYKINSEVSIKSVIKGDYGFIKTIIFFTFVPFFLMSGAFQALQTNLLHKSLTQGEILNMMLFRSAALFLLGCVVIYLVLIVAGMWRSAMQIKNETLRLTAKTITICLAIFSLIMLIYLIKAQLEFLACAIRYFSYFEPSGVRIVFMLCIIFLPYLYFLSDKQLVDYGFVSNENRINLIPLNDNGKLASLIIVFIIVWLLTLVFLPNEYEEDRYIFKGEPTFDLPDGYELATYPNNLQLYIKRENKNPNQLEGANIKNNHTEQLVESQSVDELKSKSSEVINWEARRVQIYSPELPKCYSVLGDGERIYHDFKEGECVDD